MFKFGLFAQKINYFDVEEIYYVCTCSTSFVSSLQSCQSRLSATLL